MSFVRAETHEGNARVRNNTHEGNVRVHSNSSGKVVFVCFLGCMRSPLYSHLMY
jgi:hypothetical protein